MPRTITVSAFALAEATILLSLSLAAHAAGPFNVSTIDAPKGNLTAACGVDIHGDVVGYFADGAGRHGFVLKDGGFSTITFPGAAWTAAYGVNDAGQIVGGYGSNESNGRHGFLRSGGRFSSIDFPGSSDTVARGINNHGQIVGDYQGPDGSRHGFLLSGGSYRAVALTERNGGAANGINDAGQIVGVVGSGPAAKGFLMSAGSYSAIQFPNTNYTEAWGVNDLGDVVGQIDSPEAPFRGFVRSRDDYDVIDLPGHPSSLDGRGINDLGQIVGSFTGNDGKTHGYLATPEALSVGPVDPGAVQQPSDIHVVQGPMGPQGPPGVDGPVGPEGPQGPPGPGPADLEHIGMTPAGISLEIVTDAISKAATNLLKSANQSNYVQKAIASLDVAINDVTAAIAYSNSHPSTNPPGAPVARPNFAATPPPPPVPMRNFGLYASLTHLSFAYDALARSPGDFGGFREKASNEIASAAAVLVDGINAYNAKYPNPRPCEETRTCASVKPERIP